MFNNIVQLLIKLTTIGGLVVLVTCGNTPVKHGADAKIIDLSSAGLPTVAAEFVTTREGEEHQHGYDEQPPEADKISWRFWRDSKQITIERPQFGVGELWQMDGQTIIHRKFYHGDQRAIEFQQDDLRMLQSVPSWHKLSLLLDQRLLERLTASNIDWSEGFPTRDYRGKVKDSEWHIVMRMDLALPLLIERQSEHLSERTELLHAYLLGIAPWQPTATDNYEIIDYADLGDKETDPFVIKVQAQMGHDHHH